MYRDIRDVRFFEDGPKMTGTQRVKAKDQRTTHAWMHFLF